MEGKITSLYPITLIPRHRQVYVWGVWWIITHLKERQIQHTQTSPWEETSWIPSNTHEDLVSNRKTHFSSYTQQTWHGKLICNHQKLFIHPSINGWMMEMTCHSCLSFSTTAWLNTLVIRSLDRETHVRWRHHQQQQTTSSASWNTHQRQTRHLILSFSFCLPSSSSFFK